MAILEEANLTLRSDKCIFVAINIDFLMYHRLLTDGLQSDDREMRRMDR